MLEITNYDEICPYSFILCDGVVSKCWRRHLPFTHSCVMHCKCSLCALQTSLPTWRERRQSCRWFQKVFFRTWGKHVFVRPLGVFNVSFYVYIEISIEFVRKYNALIVCPIIFKKALICNHILTFLNRIVIHKDWG